MQSAGESALQLNIPQMNSEAGSYINAASKNFSDAGSIMSALAQANEASKNAAAERALKSEMAMNEMMAKIYGIQSENMNTDKKVAMEIENNKRNNQTSAENNKRTTDASKFAASTAAAAQNYATDMSAKTRMLNTFMSQAGDIQKELANAKSNGDVFKEDILTQMLSNVISVGKPYGIPIDALTTGLNTAAGVNTSSTQPSTSTSTNQSSTTIPTTPKYSDANFESKKAFFEEFGDDAQKAALAQQEETEQLGKSLQAPIAGAYVPLYVDKDGKSLLPKLMAAGQYLPSMEQFASAINEYNSTLERFKERGRQSGYSEKQIQDILMRNPTMQKAAKKVYDIKKAIMEPYEEERKKEKKKRAEDVKRIIQSAESRIKSFSKEQAGAWFSEMDKRHEIYNKTVSLLRKGILDPSTADTILHKVTYAGTTTLFGNWRNFGPTNFEDFKKVLASLEKTAGARNLNFTNLNNVSKKLNGSTIFDYADMES